MNTVYFDYLVISAFFASAAAVVAYLLAPSEEEAILKIRAQEVRLHHRPSDALEDAELAQPLAHRLVAPAIKRFYASLLKRTPQGILEVLKVKLKEAGSPMEAGTFLSIRLLAGFVGLLLFGGMGLFRYLSGQGGGGSFLLLGLIGAYAATTIPNFFLSRAATRRKKEMLRTLPEVLDLLCISVEAGLGLEGAVQKVSERHNSPLAQELALLLKEINLGVPRDKAWRNLADRVNLQDVNVVVAAILQAEKLGASVSQVLRIQAKDTRERRRQHTEEQARQLPVKLLFPLVIFVFPSLFVVLMGPAVLQFMGSMR